MESKLFNFSEYNNNKNEINEKLDKQNLLNLLQKVPAHIAGEYSWGLAVHLEEQIAFRNFLLSGEHPNLAKYFLENFTNAQMERLYTVLLNLLDPEPDDDAIKTIINVVQSSLPQSSKISERAEKIRVILQDMPADQFDRIVRIAAEQEL